jgi:hypothetical protein
MAPHQRCATSAAAAAAAAAACLALVLLAAAPAAADGDPEQPGPDHLAFLAAQREAVLAEFAKEVRRHLLET